MSSQIYQNLSSDMDTKARGPTIWSGSDITLERIPYITLISAYIDEIEAALEKFKELGLNGPAVNADTFPLPTLGPHLKTIAQSLHEGPGFALVRGLDTEKYSDEDVMIIFLGLGSYIGSQRGSQNKSRVMISHITDAKEWQDVPSEKRHGIHTNSALPFHTDMGCEILTLLYRQVAARGGATSVASAAAIYNDLLDLPDVLKTLEAADWCVQLSGKPPRFESMPLLAKREGHVIISADPGRLGLHPTTAEKLPAGARLTEVQLRALRVLNDLAEKHSFSIPAQAGDILFLNNLGVLHKRDSYVDDAADEGKAKRRWLMRLWLRNDTLGWGIPESMKTPWEAAYGKEIGRFIEEKYDPTPQPDYKVPKYTSGTASWLIEDDEA